MHFFFDAEITNMVTKTVKINGSKKPADGDKMTKGKADEEQSLGEKSTNLQSGCGTRSPRKVVFKDTVNDSFNDESYNK